MSFALKFPETQLIRYQFRDTHLIYLLVLPQCHLLVFGLFLLVILL